MLLWFSLKPFLKRLAGKQFFKRLVIILIEFGDKALQTQT